MQRLMGRRKLESSRKFIWLNILLHAVNILLHVRGTMILSWCGSKETFYLIKGELPYGQWIRRLEEHCTFLDKNEYGSMGSGSRIWALDGLGVVLGERRKYHQRQARCQWCQVPGTNARWQRPRPSMWTCAFLSMRDQLWSPPLSNSLK